jgi:hypothetical protein
MIGDHIRARKGGRWTHAIDCGDKTVIFLREDEGVAPADRILRSYRPTFEAEADAVEVVTHRERVFPPRQVVARAYSRTQNPALATVFGDSEAFAEWCKTGRVLNGAYNYAVAVPGVPADARARNRATASARPAAAKALPAKAVKAQVKAAFAKAKAKPPAVKAKAAVVKAKPAPARAKAAKAKVAAKAKPAARKAKVVAKAKPVAKVKAKKPAPARGKIGARKAAGAKRR